MGYTTITGGKFRGLKIRVPKNVRATQTRVKKAIFDILSSKIKDKIFADLFAGSGNIGIEALSRGASFVYFVEKNRKNVNIIRENVQKIEMTEKSEIFEGDVKVFLRREFPHYFDIIFADPPYNFIMKKGFMELIFNKLKDNGIFIYETRKNIEVKFTNKNIKEVYYGDTKIFFIGDISW